MRRRSPVLAAALSFLFPGLGQAYAGFGLLALVLAAPVAFLMLAALLALKWDPAGLSNVLVSASFLTSLLALDLALLAWRCFAIIHAWLTAPRLSGSRSAPVAPGLWRRERPITYAVVSMLLVVTVGMHAWAGVLVSRLDASLGQVFSGVAGARGRPAGLNQPDYHWNGTSRLTFLLLGIDGGAYRVSDNTDTILVVSIDPLHHTAVMVSVPRDTGWLPLPDRRIYANGRYPAKINSLAPVAGHDPQQWCPDLPVPTDCGIRTLERSVGLYLGIDINYYATLNLVGFAKLINAIGGVRICVPGILADPLYGGPTWYPRQGITLQPGCQMLDGPHALAYARIRKGTLTLRDGTVQPQDDFKREARQQEVLLALHQQFATANWLTALPDLLAAVGEMVATDFPRGQAGDLASLLPLISGAHAVQRVVLSLPEYVTLAPDPQINYLLIPNREAIRAKMTTLFGLLKGWYMGGTSLYPPNPAT